MRRFRNILVPIEGDPARQPVLARAVRVAKENGAAIRLIAVVEELPWYSRLALPNSEKFDSDLVQERSRVLERLAEDLRSDGTETSTKVLRGRRHLEIIREVLRGKHDLLMKEAEPNDSVLFGSTDMQLLRTCPCPLWLFKPEHAGRDFTQILAAVDPVSQIGDSNPLALHAEIASRDEGLDAKILELAGTLADKDRAELHVLHAWSAPGEGLARGNAMLQQEQVDRYVEDSRSEARKALERLLKGVSEQPRRFIVHQIKGQPAEVITAFAKQHNIDLIVMGTVGRSGIPGLLIGNTAETILQRVDCSVLAIKPDGFICPVTLDN